MADALANHSTDCPGGTAQVSHCMVLLLCFTSFATFLSVSMFSPSGGAAFDHVYHKHLPGRTVNPSEDLREDQQHTCITLCTCILGWIRLCVVQKRAFKCIFDIHQMAERTDLDQIICLWRAFVSLIV